LIPSGTADTAAGDDERRGRAHRGRVVDEHARDRARGENHRGRREDVDDRRQRDHVAAVRGRERLLARAEPLADERARGDRKAPGEAPE